MTKASKSFMAFSMGQENAEAQEFKNYWGIAPVKVKAIQPTKAELEEFYGRTIENDPIYVTEKEKNGVKVRNVRVDFLIETVPAKEGENPVKSKISFFVSKAPFVNKDKTKCKVIDVYSRTAWVTNEEYSAKAIPQYSNGPARISNNYRAAYQGEEELTTFIKTWLNIPSVDSYIDGAWVPNPKFQPSQCEARLDNIDALFNGDYSELKNLVKLLPENKIWVLFGVRHNDEGKAFQCVFNRHFETYVKNRNPKFDRFRNAVDEVKATGFGVNEDYSFNLLSEYVVESTDFDTAPAEETNNPWDTPAESETSTGLPF